MSGAIFLLPPYDFMKREKKTLHFYATVQVFFILKGSYNNFPMAVHFTKHCTLDEYKCRRQLTDRPSADKRRQIDTSNTEARHRSWPVYNSFKFRQKSILWNRAGHVTFTLGPYNSSRTRMRVAFVSM